MHPDDFPNGWVHAEDYGEAEWLPRDASRDYTGVVTVPSQAPSTVRNSASAVPAEPFEGGYSGGFRDRGEGAGATAYGREWAGSRTGSLRCDAAIVRGSLEDIGFVSLITPSMTWDEMKDYVCGQMSRD